MAQFGTSKGIVYRVYQVYCTALAYRLPNTRSLYIGPSGIFFNFRDRHTGVNAHAFGILTSAEALTGSSPDPIELCALQVFRGSTSGHLDASSCPFSKLLFAIPKMLIPIGVFRLDPQFMDQKPNNLFDGYPTTRYVHFVKV
jgi:hypothetical protein